MHSQGFALFAGNSSHRPEGHPCLRSETPQAREEQECARRTALSLRQRLF